jgi:hypothetical protein
MTTRWRRGAQWMASAGMVLSLAACATGQGSFVAGSGGGGDEQALTEEQTFEETAPGLLAASGNALLPGGRILAAPSANTAISTASSIAPPLLTTGPVAANVDASVNLLNGAAVSANLTTSLASVRTNVSLGGPLLALNGSQAALLGLGVTGPTVLGTTPNLTATLGAAVNPATAATQTLISATVGATQTPVTPPITSPGTGTPSLPPILPPALLPPSLGVPGTTPLQTLLPLLRPTSTPPLLPGLLGN